MQLLPIIIMLITSLFYMDALHAQENSADTENISKYLSTIIAPEPIKRVNPKYPMSAARQSREGWAILSFVINKEGGVEDILVKSSSGSKDLTRAAEIAAKKWRYKPAMEDGKAIPQCVNTVRMDFRMGKHTTGATKKFISKYNKARAALTAKDFVTLDDILDQMNKNKYMHLSENNYLHWLSADYAKEQGDKRKQLYHLNRVAVGLSSLSNDKQKLSVLYQAFNLQVELNEFKAAHSTYERLIKLPSAEPYLTQLADVMANVESVISGDKDLVITADIKNDFWSTDLVRNEFSLIDIEGSLHTLDVRCANKRHVYTIEKDNTWKLPASWENCSIYVYGEQKSTFKLIEHPFTT
ncbi:energy transducer TonB [Colwellia sp. 12G3]|uniref:energy transducer TonB n=1 Tax=Colwellia sp. 12G3 TaxID=2058299 RepID=UPI000C33FB0A|nr:energy transducer TonB [Colwellia sp. 12G3]PKI13526.1 energy transducer TonB [Colwellia sp. 12G3]